MTHSFFWAGREFSNAVAVMTALGINSREGAAAFLQSVPSHAQNVDAHGTLYIATASIHTPPGFGARLDALRHRDFNARPVAAPLAEPHRSVATPASGSIEATRANAREVLGKHARNTTGSKSERMLAALERARAEQPSE